MRKQRCAHVDNNKLFWCIVCERLSSYNRHVHNILRHKTLICNKIDKFFTPGVVKSDERDEAMDKPKIDLTEPA